MNFSSGALKFSTVLPDIKEGEKIPDILSSGSFLDEIPWAGYWKSEHPDVHSYLLLEKGRGIQAEVTALIRDRIVQRQKEIRDKGVADTE
jgi:hypothetical protein